MASGAPSPRRMHFALGVQRPFLELSHDDALDLLEWLGLGRAEFGAVEVSILLPLCRRRLWPEARNFDSAVSRGGRQTRAAGTLRCLAGELAARIAVMPGALVHFG